ncbi:MAG: RNA methyltransferase [Anaerolineales bacterium]|nr:RNA methyltransferase [Anaerolineales bacterium]
MSNQLFSYYAQTPPGAEEIAWLEIRWRLPGAKFGEYLFAKEQNGVVTFDYAGDMADVQQLETAEEVYLQALSIPKLSRGKRDLERIRDLVTKAESLGRAGNQLMRFRQFSRPPAYRVVSRKFGRHEYSLKALQKAVLQGMQSRYPRWTPVTDGAQVELSVDLLGSHLLCGFNITDKQTRKSRSLRQKGGDGVRPSLAAALVLLTEPEAEDVFLDPLCANGRLLYTRRLLGRYGRLIGVDPSPEQLAIATENLVTRRKGRLPESIDLQPWAEDGLPLADASVDKAATVLPDSAQVGGEREMKGLYTAVFQELARVLRPDGRAIILSREYDQVKACLRDRPMLEIQTGYSVKAGAQWGRIYIIKRLEA